VADPITAGIAIGAVTSAAAAGMGGVAQSQQATAESKAAQYNADVLVQQGNAASNSAASNEGASLRRSAGDLGEQAAAIGQSGTGTGGSAQGVMKQSATNARLDALNIWYGGELERHQDLAAANLQRYNAEVYKRNSDTALTVGFGRAGTSLLMGGADYGAYKKYGLPGLNALNASGGTF
jgi:hypothetical protein